LPNKPFVEYAESLKEKARDNRKEPTPAEKLLWNFLRRKQIKGYNFHRQKPLGKYIVDFYCSRLKLVVEIDGDSHAFQKDYDEKRTKELKENGLEVVRYWNNEVMGNIDGVYEDLLNKIEQIEKPPQSPLSGGF
jgi:very-short-patch-repair endonuclease